MPHKSGKGGYKPTPGHPKPKPAPAAQPKHKPKHK